MGDPYHWGYFILRRILLSRPLLFRSRIFRTTRLSRVRLARRLLDDLPCPLVGVAGTLRRFHTPNIRRNLFPRYPPPSTDYEGPALGKVGIVASHIARLIEFILSIPLKAIEA